VLPLLAWLLLGVLCRRRWRPWLLLGGLVLLAGVTPGWLIFVHTVTFLPDGARLWLPAYLMWFVGGMVLAVLQAMGVRCYAFAVLPVVVISYFIASTPLAGEPTTSPYALAPAVWKAVFYAAIATLVVAPLALMVRRRDGDRAVDAREGLYVRVLASRPMVFLGEISYEIFLIHLVTMELVMVELLDYHIYTGSVLNLFVLTMVVTVPLAWLLHRFTRVRPPREPRPAPSVPN
jgi:peptidoglycan/LPS O-acetylase OafA/YrhL